MVEIADGWSPRELFMVYANHYGFYPFVNREGRVFAMKVLMFVDTNIYSHSKRDLSMAGHASL